MTMRGPSSKSLGNVLGSNLLIAGGRELAVLQTLRFLIALARLRHLRQLSMLFIHMQRTLHSILQPLQPLSSD